MAGAALDIVDEYLMSPNPQVRKNALTALAVLDTPESLRRLLQTALLEPRSDVRDHAESEISRLGSPAHMMLTEFLDKALDDRATRAEAYRMIGRLASRGMDIRLAPPLAARFWMPTRVALAFLDSVTTNPWREWAFWRRPLWPSILAGVVASISWQQFVAAYTRLSSDRGLSPQFAVNSFLYSVVLSALLSCATTVWTLPISQRFDRLAGVLVDLVLVYLLGLVLSMIYFSAWSLLSDVSRVSMGRASSAAFVSPLFLVSVRLGTLCGIDISRDRSWNRWAQIALGGCAGILVLSLLTALYTSPDPEGWSPLSQFIAATWFVLVPTAFALASAFASIDMIAPVLVPVLPRRVAVACLTIPAATAVLAVSLLVYSILHRGKNHVTTIGPGERPVVRASSTSANGPANKSFPIFALPTTVGLELQDRMHVYAVLETNRPVPNLHIFLIEGADVLLDKSEINIDLPAGVYLIALSRSNKSLDYQYLNANEVFQQMKRQLQAVLLPGWSSSDGNAPRTGESLGKLRISISIIP